MLSIQSVKGGPRDYRLTVDDAIAEHDAVRDDLAMAAQVGWFPPRPSYVADAAGPARVSEAAHAGDVAHKPRLLTEAGSVSGEIKYVGTRSRGNVCRARALKTHLERVSRARIWPFRDRW